MNKTYIFSFFIIILLSKKNSTKITRNLFFITVIWIINVLINKSINFYILENFKYSNFIWDWVSVLNSNNKSIIFFIILAVFFLFKGLKFKTTNMLLNLLITLIFYSATLKIKNNYYIFNQFWDININLTNGLILVHPISMYIAYAIFVVFLKNLSRFSFKPNLLVLKNKCRIYKKLFFCSFALLLGGYWSQQELNWGGWWNWDFVEIIAFIFFLLSCLIVHMNQFNNLNYFINISGKIINYFILFFFIIRLDIINSIHSFSVFNKSNFNINLMLSIYIIFIITVVIRNNNSYNKYYNNINKNSNVLTLLFLLILLLFNIYIYINIIISILYDIQFIELTKYLKNFLNSILLGLLMYITKNVKNLIYLCIIFYISLKLYNNIWLYYCIILINIIIVIYNYKNTYKNINHIFISIFIIINNYYYVYQYYSIKLYLMGLNIVLLNNINILDDFSNHLIYYYNNNNYLIMINNYYYCNNNILFNNSSLKELLLNNILLINNNVNINYKIDDKNMLFNFNIIFLILFYILVYKIRLKKDNIV